MAFEEDLGHDPALPIDQDYSVSATGLISRTLSLLTSKFVQYIIIVGIIGAACAIFSFVLLNTMFGLEGVILADPIGYFIALFLLDPSPDVLLAGVSVGYGFFALILNAIIGGAAIKFTLDEYGGTRGDIGTSFSHSIRRFPLIIIVQLLISTLVAVILTPATIWSAQALDMIDMTDPFNPIFPPGSIELMMQSMLLMVVGGLFIIYVQIRLTPTLAIIMNTDLSALDSLKKSWEITSGNIIHILVGIFLLGIVNLGLQLLVNIIIGVDLGAVLFILLFGALTYIFGVVLYRDLSSRAGSSSLSSSLDDLRI